MFIKEVITLYTIILKVLLVKLIIKILVSIY